MYTTRSDIATISKMRVHLFAVDHKVIVSEGEPAFREVVVSRLVVIGHFRDGGRCYLPWSEGNESQNP